MKNYFNQHQTDPQLVVESQIVKRSTNDSIKRQKGYISASLPLRLGAILTDVLHSK